MSIRRDVHEMIYERLTKVVPNLLDLSEGESLKLKSEYESFMDLNVDILSKDEDSIRIALSHYFRQNGDSIADPDMELVIYPKYKRAYAETYQDQFGYQTIYPKPGYTNPTLARQLNKFLNQWLRNIISQKYKRQAVEQ